MFRPLRRWLIALIVLCGSSAAYADFKSVIVCVDPEVVSGQSEASCDGAFQRNFPSEWVTFDTLVVCDPADADWSWKKVSELTATDTIWWVEGGSPQSLSFFTFGGDSGGDDFDISQIDLAKAGGFFSVGFLIVGSCWAIGKGASVILHVVKRG